MITTVGSMPFPTVLFVDDENEVINGIELIFHHQPYHVLSANSASEALDMLQTEDIDIIVSDERMTGMSGTDFLSHVYKTWPHIQRIILTGHANVNNALRAINDVQVFRFLEKPCPSEKLLESVEAAVNAQRREKSVANLVNAAHQHLHTINNHHVHIKTDSVPTNNRHLLPGLNHKQMASLSTREKQVLEHLVQSQRVAKIAELLFISPHTVRNHLKSLFYKLQAHSQSELINLASGRDYK